MALVEPVRILLQKLSRDDETWIRTKVVGKIKFGKTYKRKK